MLLLQLSSHMLMVKCYEASLNVDCSAAVWLAMTMGSVCGREWLSGFSSLLSIDLTYTWGCKRIFAEGCVWPAVSSS